MIRGHHSSGSITRECVAALKLDSPLADGDAGLGEIGTVSLDGVGLLCILLRPIGSIGIAVFLAGLIPAGRPLEQRLVPTRVGVTTRSVEVRAAVPEEENQEPVGRRRP